MKKALKQNETGAAHDGRTHTDIFAQAMKVFHQSKYEEAAALFEKAASGPLTSVNESAQMYLRMCQQRMGISKVELESPDDHYNYAVSLINARKYREARASLEAAAVAGPEPHFSYAMALVEGNLGSMDAAAGHLRRAIQMDPSLRGRARTDPDFAPLLQHPKLKEAVAPAQSSGGGTGG